MTLFIPKWLLWLFGAIVGLPIALILIVALVYGLMIIWMAYNETR